MRDGSNSMSEQEFLHKFIRHIRHDGYMAFTDKVKGRALIDWVDGFLQLHHNSYYEVEFVPVLPESDDEYETYNRSQ